MPLAVQIQQTGGPEAMQLVQVPVAEPQQGEVRVRHHAIGLNFIDVYQRTGLYQLPLPLQLGMEAAGVVEAVGPGVAHLSVGDRVAYATNPPGSYSELRTMPAQFVCRLPDGIGFETGAAMMLKGMTAQYLLKRCRPAEGLEAGDGSPPVVPENAPALLARFFYWRSRGSFLVLWPDVAECGELGIDLRPGAQRWSPALP